MESIPDNGYLPVSPWDLSDGLWHIAVLSQDLQIV
jgi:hypothetical protein